MGELDPEYPVQLQAQLRAYHGKQKRVVRTQVHHTYSAYQFHEWSKMLNTTSVRYHGFCSAKECQPYLWNKYLHKWQDSVYISFLSPSCHVTVGKFRS